MIILDDDTPPPAAPIAVTAAASAASSSDRDEVLVVGVRPPRGMMSFSKPTAVEGSNCAGSEYGLGCLVCEDLANKNGPLKLGERITCPDGLDYGRKSGTGPKTCQFGCDVCLGNSKPPARKSKPANSGTININSGAIVVGVRPPVVEQAGGADEDPNESPEGDPLSHRTQMVLALASQKRGVSFVDAATLKSVLVSVVSNVEPLIELVLASPDAALADELRTVITRPLTHYVGPGQRVGKYHHSMKLVDVWLVWKNIDALRTVGGGTRSRSLDLFIGTMTSNDEAAVFAVIANRERFRAWKSDPIPRGERGREYMKGGGVALNPSNYPCCPNKECGHHLIDGPPGNVTADETNRLKLDAYMVLSEEFRNWKKDLGPQPRCPTSGDLLTKPPPGPTPLKKYLRCHCSQNRADFRSGKVCAVRCFYKGQQYDLGRCPLCTCTCIAYIPLQNYRTIVTVSSMPRERDTAANTRDDAITYLERGLDVNMAQQRASARAHSAMLRNGGIAHSSNVVNAMQDEGACAQALDLAGNPPSQQTVMHLRGIVDRVEDPRGASFTVHGDMNVHGRAGNAAAARASNNNLAAPAAASVARAGTPSAARAGEKSPTPKYMASTRRAVNVNRMKNRNTMTKVERRRSARVCKGLSRPRDEGLVNVLKEAQNKSTPEREKVCMEYAEDVEDE